MYWVQYRATIPAIIYILQKSSGRLECVYLFDCGYIAYDFAFLQSSDNAYVTGVKGETSFGAFNAQEYLCYYNLSSFKQVFHFV